MGGSNILKDILGDLPYAFNFHVRRIVHIARIEIREFLLHIEGQFVDFGWLNLAYISIDLRAWIDLFKRHAFIRVCQCCR